MLLPSDAATWWVVLASSATLATWRCWRWAGVWWGAAFTAGGWAYLKALWGASVPYGYYALLEFIAGVGLAGLGACLWTAGAALLNWGSHAGHKRAIRFAGALGLGATGLSVGYLGPLVTGGVNSHSDLVAGVEEATIKAFDMAVYHEIGRPGEVINSVERFWWKVFLPSCGLVGTVTGTGVGWVAFHPRFAKKAKAETPTPRGSAST